MNKLGVVYLSIESFKMLEPNILAFGVNTMPADALAPTVGRVSAGIVLCVLGQRTCFAIPELISSTWVKPSPRYYSKCEYMYIFCNL